SLRALASKRFEDRLVRCVFELKAIMLNGEFPGISSGDMLGESTVYTITYIMNTPSERLFSFDVKPQVLEELKAFCRKICQRTFDKDFKSLEILENLE
ncbi:MAG: DNA repair protein RecO, partial [Lachnospiraceae bacterium]|nr:DNA repair protein RecO [Lachnospiraceae bacterium]